MSANRRTEEQSAARRTNRHQNSSPYPKKKPAAPAPSKQSSGIKAASTFVSLFSFLNPFRSKDETPPAVPRLLQQQDQMEDQSFEDDYEQDVTEAEGFNDTPYREKQPASIASGPTSNSPHGRRNNQIPFPLASSPQKRTNDGAGPSTPNNSRNMPPPPPRNILATPPQQQQLPRYNFSLSNNMSPLAASASIRDLLGERVKAGEGLTSEEAQQLLRVVSAEPSREAPLPTAAYLGRGFVPSPSRSFLAPPPPLQSAGSSTSQPFTFTSGKGSASTSSSTSTSTSPCKTPRRRPVYVGPGQSLKSTSRSPRTGMGLRATSSNLSSLAGPSSGLSRTSTMDESAAGADAQVGKRRRVEGMIGPQSGLGVSSSQSMFGVNSAATAEPQHQQGPAFTFSSDDFGGRKQVNGISSDKGKETHASHGRQQSTENNDAASPDVPTRRTSLAVINTAGFLRPTANPTPSPAVPSPLRNVTKPIDSPSPPRRSRTSAAVLGIIKDVDHELKTSASSNSMDVDDFVNPYESQGPKPPPIIRSRKKPATKKPVLPPPEPPRKSALPSSVQAIADSLPSKKSSIPIPTRAHDAQAKETAEQNRRKDRNPPPTMSKSSTTTAKPLSKQNPQPQQSKSSPFLPPAKTNGSSKATKNSGKYTIYDVDEDDDDGMDIQELPSPPKKAASSKPNGFSSSSRNSPPPPPILISEMDVEEEQDPSLGGSSGSKVTQKPSLVIEPGESSRRLGRSPSLGPPGNLYSPTIPSPLRLVSMPGQPEQEEEVMEVEKDQLEGDTDTETENVTENQGQKPTAAADVDMSGEKREEVKDPKDMARNAAASTLPAFTFDAVVFAVVERTGPGVEAARRAPVDALPKFAFSLTATATTSTFGLFAAKPANNSGEWTCNTCMLKNPASVTSKCTICDANRPVAAMPPPASAPASFNWAASGFAPKATDGVWTCSTCMCSNPASAKQKCRVCEAPAPHSAGNAVATAAPVPPAAPPIAAFNWSAAGFAAKAPAPGTWTCSTCQLSNPADVAKCTVCGDVKV